jgi:hypothetical protein
MTPPPHRLFEQAWPEGGFRFWQMGFVTDDLYRTARQLVDTFGVGPFHVLPLGETQATLHGEPAPLDLQVAVAQAGPVQIELFCQTCDRPSIYRELQARGGSSFHQICTVTTDYPGTIAHYEGLGYEVASEIVARGQHVGFVDTNDDFGFYTEVVEDVPGFLEATTKISETCATWDGTDPIRILTRDGYRVPDA